MVTYLDTILNNDKKSGFINILIYSKIYSIKFDIGNYPNGQIKINFPKDWYCVENGKLCLYVPNIHKEENDELFDSIESIIGTIVRPLINLPSQIQTVH